MKNGVTAISASPDEREVQREMMALDGPGPGRPPSRIAVEGEGVVAWVVSLGGLAALQDVFAIHDGQRFAAAAFTEADPQQSQCCRLLRRVHTPEWELGTLPRYVVPVVPFAALEAQQRTAALFRIQ